MQREFSPSKELDHLQFTTTLVKVAYGLDLGLLQFIYQVFLYDHFGGNAQALKITVSLMVLSAIVILFSEVPTGAWGDYVGRKKAIIACFLFAGVASFFRSWIYFIPSYFSSLALAVTVVLFNGFSHTLFSGTFTAWVTDSAKKLKATEGHGPILARAASYGMLAKILGAVISLALYLSGYVFYAFSLSCVTSILCAIYCGVTMKETEGMQFHRGPLPKLGTVVEEMGKIIKTGFFSCLETPSLMYLIITTSSILVLSSIVNGLWPIYMKANFGVEKMSYYWFAIVFSGMIFAFLGTKWLEILQKNFLKKNHHEKSSAFLWNWYITICLLMAAPFLVLGFWHLNYEVNLFLFIGVFILFNIGYGFLLPADDILINYYVKTTNSRERATIISFGSMSFEFFRMFLLFPSSGSDGKSIAVGWLVPATILVVVAIIMHILMRRHQRRTAAELLNKDVVVVESGV